MKSLIFVMVAVCALNTAAQKKVQKVRGPIFSSVYSDMGKGKSCKTVEEETIECRPIGGYWVYAGFHNVFESVWIENAEGETIAEIPSAKTGGISRSLGKFEWRLADGKPFAIIARFGFYPMDEADQTGANIWSDKRKFAELLVVKGLPGFEQIDVELDARLTPNPNQKARDLADKGFMSKLEMKNMTLAHVISPRRLLIEQPDFAAGMSCLKYEKTFGHGYGEAFRSAKKGDLYRHEGKDYIDYFSPNSPPVRYSFKTKTFEHFTGDVENHLWFESLESPALLARDESLKFEIVGKESVNFEIDGKPDKRELIKIRATGETEAGGDWDKAEAFLYLAPHLQNLVVKTELIFPNARRSCELRNISLNVPDLLFEQFDDYRKSTAKNASRN